MPFKPPPHGKSIASLRESLADSRIQKENNALYQTIFGLITLAQDFQDGLEESFKTTDNLPATQLEGVVPYQQGGVQTGYFLPTLINIVNATGVEAGNYNTTWWRMGNIVFVSGKINAPIDAGDVLVPVLTQIEMVPPFGSLFAHTEQASGVLAVNPFAAVVPMSAAGICWANPGNLNIVLEFWAPFFGSTDLRFMYSYEYIPLNS